MLEALNDLTLSRIIEKVPVWYEETKRSGGVDKKEDARSRKKVIWEDREAHLERRIVRGGSGRGRWGRWVSVGAIVVVLRSRCQLLFGWEREKGGRRAVKEQEKGIRTTGFAVKLAC